MKDIKELEGLEIFLGYKCNVNCEFCYQRDLRKKYIFKDFKTDYIKKLLKRGFNEGKKFIIFSGGEPTIRKDLLELISYSKQIGYMYIRVHSNGFGFQKKEYLEKLYKAGLNGITISIHGFGEMQDKITGVKGNFKLLNKALHNINNLIKKDSKFILDTNTVIYKGNKNNLMKLFLYLFRFNINRSQVNYSSSMKTFLLREKINILEKYEILIPILEKILILSLKENKKVVIDSIPYCIIGENFWFALDNNIKNDRESFSTNGNNEKTYDETYNNIKTKKCLECSKNYICKGIPQDYYEVFGDSELTPILGKKVY